MPPADTVDSKESDKANPGEVRTTKSEQRQAEKGKYGSVPIVPFKPPVENSTIAQETGHTSEQKKEETSWIEIELLGEDDKPIPGEKYRITLPGGTVAEGTLDQKGQARAEGFEAGSCMITFPDLDSEMWEEN